MKYLLAQVVLLNPALLPAMARGARWLWRDRRYRPLVWAFALLEAFFLATGGKPYYPAPILLLIAAAGIAATPALRDGPARRSRILTRYAVIGAFGVLLLPAVLPVLPEEVFAASPYAAADDARATIGWPQLAAQVDTVAALVGARHPVVLTESYGEAGAIERFGSPLLTVVSGHNSLWGYARPPDDTATVIVVGYPPGRLAAWFAQCRQVTTLHTPYGLDNQENGAPVSVCSGPRRPWSLLWPAIRHDN